MLHLQKTLPRKNNLPSLTPVRSNGKSVGTWTEFDFWGDQSSRVYDNYNSDDCGAFSPQFCTYPLLPQNHHYSCPPLSPKSRLQAIVDDRKELMEIIQDMPESSYELSLKDIVDEQQEAKGKDITLVERSLKYKPDITKQKKKIMSRSESMDSGVFLLKMHFPSFGMKGKSTAGNHRSKVVSEGSDKMAEKEWWRVRFLSTGKGNRRGKSSISGSNSGSSSSGSSREDDSDFMPGCWSFRKKCRSRQQRGAAYVGADYGHS